MTDAIAGVRRLPWLTDSGKPVYLATDDAQSLLALMADDVEAQYIDGAEKVLGLVTPLLGTPLTAEEAAFMLRRTVECLRDVIDVARLRGERLE